MVRERGADGGAPQEAMQPQRSIDRWGFFRGPKEERMHEIEAKAYLANGTHPQAEER